MGKDLFESRCKQFRETVICNGNLPRIWQFRFNEDGIGMDQRLWFNKISRLEQYKEYVEEIDNILKGYKIKRLSDEEREREFRQYVIKRRMIPSCGEVYFSDNEDMYKWYVEYKNEHDEYEEVIHRSLPEYMSFEIAEVWPDCKKEFVMVVQRLKRIPKHGQVKLSNGIDVKVIFDKLVSFEPKYAEMLLLNLASLSNKKLSYDERAHQLVVQVSMLGYIPFLQECRFSDGTDMFTWYDRYKDRVPKLKDMVESLVVIGNTPKRKINIYLMPEFEMETGRFYAICSNEGEVLDISSISSVGEAKELDSTFRRRGGLTLDKDEEIDKIVIGRGRK